MVGKANIQKLILGHLMMDPFALFVGRDVLILRVKMPNKQIQPTRISLAADNSVRLAAKTKENLWIL